MALVWVNGQPHSQISSFDRGLAFGDGVFETIARARNHWVLWPEHVDRLQRGIAALDIPFDLDKFRDDWSRFNEVCGADNGIAKVIVTRGESTRGYCPHPDAKASTIFQWFPSLPVATKSVSLGVCKVRLASQPMLAGLKHLNRLEQVLASHEVRNSGWDDGLLLDQAGHVIETTSKNIFFIKGFRLITPPIIDCGVAGTLRNWIFNVLPTLGLDSSAELLVPQEQVVSLDDLLEADEVFVCNSVLGVLPVKQLNNRCYGRSPLTLKVRSWVEQTLGIGA